MNTQIHAHDFVHLVYRNFRPFQWAAAYEGLEQGVRAWNEKYANGTRQPGGFLLVVCRRRVFDAYRAGKLIHPYNAYSQPTVPSAKRRKILGDKFPWVVCRQTIGADGPDQTGVMFHPQRTDVYAVGVIDALDDTSFMDARDTIDFCILRMLASGKHIKHVAVAVGLSTATIHKRVDALRTDYRLHHYIRDRRSVLNGSLPVSRKRADAIERPPPACRDASPAEPRKKAIAPKQEVPQREPWT